MPRLQVLSQKEQSEFDNPPNFNNVERKHFFNLPKSIMNKINAMRLNQNKIAFTVMYAYFNSAKRFFAPSSFKTRDIEAACKKLQLNSNQWSATQLSKENRIRYEKIILDHFAFQAYNNDIEKIIYIEIQAMSKAHLRPKMIFHRCVDLLHQKRIEAPTSNAISRLIALALRERKDHLSNMLNEHIDDNTKKLLDSLFEVDQKSNRYVITLLKKLSQSVRPKKIKECVDDFKVVENIFKKIEPLLSKIDLGMAGTKYFASSVMKSQVFHLQRKSDADKYIHTMAFIAHQYYRSQDNLIDLWLKVWSSFNTSSVNKYKELSYESQQEQQSKFNDLLSSINVNVFEVLSSIKGIALSHNIDDSEKIMQIQALVTNDHDSKVSDIKNELQEKNSGCNWYDTLEAGSLKIQQRLNTVLKHICFTGNSRSEKLLNAISYFKNNDGTIDYKAPQDFLSAEHKKNLMTKDGGFRASLYKVLLFQEVTSAIKSGDLNLAQSYKYRTMDTYLISKERWELDKSRLLGRADLLNCQNPRDVISELKKALHAQFELTNSNASSNALLSFNKEGMFHISTPAASEQYEDESYKDLFPQRHDVPLAQVLETVNLHTNMLNSFEHSHHTHTKASTEKHVMLAGIMGLGCGIGVRKMARISKEVNESELEYAVNWRFSIENVRAANDIVIKSMDAMDLPNIYRRKRNLLHTSSDALKFEVKGNALHASRSFKYFGQGQGVSANAFIDERNFLWHSHIISSAHRESMYVIDGLMHNETIKSDMHSTDTHGYTEAVFGLTHLLGFSFAPRIKKVGKQSLYIFKDHPKESRNLWKIKPDKYINEKIIEQNWDDLLRLVTTIKLKENTASDIFRRLNSYSKQHALYQAIKSLGQIVKTNFILRYVNDTELRQAIEKQLNKVELANRFTRAISVGNSRELIHTDKDQQDIAEACNRLIKNSIICWNYLYLAHKLAREKCSETKLSIRESIQVQSPISWAHINMLGEYDFSEENLKDTLGIIPKKVA